MNDFAETLEEAEVEEVAETEAEVKEEKPDDLLDDFRSWVEDGIADDDIIIKLHEDYDMTFPQAVNRYRKLKRQAGMTSPRGHKAADVKAFMKEQSEAGLERKEIIDAMVEKFGYTKNSAASVFSTQGKDIGLSGSGVAGVRVPLADTVKFLRENYGMPKQELLAKMKEELGYAESTCNAFYIYIPMAVEWAKQETEA